MLPLHFFLPTRTHSQTRPQYSGILHNIATHCNIPQRTTIRYNTLQHTATHCNTLQHTATHCNTLQHTTTHCNTLQHIATRCNTLQHTATRCNTLQPIATHRHSFHKRDMTIQAGHAQQPLHKGNSRQDTPFRTFCCRFASFSPRRWFIFCLMVSIFFLEGITRRGVAICCSAIGVPLARRGKCCGVL